VHYDAGPAVLMTKPQNGAPQPVDLRGDIHLPAGRGPFPVVLLMHGRHGTCSFAGFEELGHPCPETPATSSVASYTGYRYLATNLASHGYLVLSVDANGINTYDTADFDSGAVARAELVSRSLDLLGQWNTAAGPGDVGRRLVGRVDLRRIGVMGHSRGGEGVTRWLAYNRSRTDGARYHVSGVFALAPTDFGDLVIDDATPYAVLLPRCDGDVSDLQGADVFERSQYAGRGPLHAITVEGANHNWFNSVWTFDDFGKTGDDACGTQSEETARLTDKQQARVGLAWMAAFFRRYVGGERQFDPMLTGRGARSSQCSAAMAVRCADLTDLSYHPPLARRTTLLVPAISGSGVLSGQKGGRLSASRGMELAACDSWKSMPCPQQNKTPSRANGPQLSLSWETRSSLTLSATTRWRGDRRGDVVVRLGVNATDEPHRVGEGRLRLRVQLTDTTGRTRVVAVTQAMGAPEPPPGSAVRNLLLNDVRVPLRLFSGVDVASLRSVRLLFDDASGSVQLADLSLQTG
jgi:dienelactone hydrolase